MAVKPVAKDAGVVPTVHVRGASAIRRPLLVLAVCAVGAICYLARDFLIPTAGAVVLALLLTPVATVIERLRIPAAPAAALAVLLFTLFIGGLLAIAVPSVARWAEETPLLAHTLERKLEGLRESLAFFQEMTEKVEKATSPEAKGPVEPAGKVVVRERSMLATLASATPFMLLQVGYAWVLAFMLLAYRNAYRRQVLLVPADFHTRVHLARVMRDINERVGHYLLSLAAIYGIVGTLATVALALLGFPNPLVWGACLGFASFVPYVGPPVVFGLVALIGLITFDDWPRMVAAPAILAVIHFAESQFVTPHLLSRRCSLSATAVFVGIALLGWMWGAVGAIIAVPLLILLSTVSAHLPSLHWLDVLLADDRPVAPRLAVKPPLASAPRRASARSAQPRRRLAAAK